MGNSGSESTHTHSSATREENNITGQRASRGEETDVSSGATGGVEFKLIRGRVLSAKLALL
jgi:hypothetical protein